MTAAGDTSTSAYGHHQRPRLIAVDGRSGSGKTTLADQLAEALDCRVTVFHLEDIYPGWDGLCEGMATYLNGVVRALCDGRNARWREWDWTANAPGAERTLDPDAYDVVILEGVGTGHAAARELIDATVWIEGTEQLRRDRALARDGETFRPHWQRWADQETAWLANDDVATAADVVVRGPAQDGDADAVLDALAQLPVVRDAVPVPAAERRGLIHRSFPLTTDTGTLASAILPPIGDAIWLDSSNAGIPPTDDRARFSILADGSGALSKRVSHQNGVTSVTTDRLTYRVRGGFFAWLDTQWPAQPNPSRPPGYDGPFLLGWLGWLGYELKRETGGADRFRSPVPDAAFLVPERTVVVDHRDQQVHLLTWDTDDAREWLEHTAELIVNATPTAAKPSGEPVELTPVMDEPEYVSAVETALDRIADGISYEVCLTTAFTGSADAGHDWLAAYLRLRSDSPAPFASFMRIDGVTLLSSSPERFLRIEPDGTLRTEPIKGTRKRGNNPVAEAKELAQSAKDRAENLMIVDLVRNDLSRVARPGSVRVERLFDVETYATVHQMVSTVSATLDDGVRPVRAIAEAFPPGSMTGAPKISTMAVIDELETQARGPYSGVLGYLSADGSADLSVTIRTAVVSGETVHLGVGGAVIAESDPQAEWDEVVTKSAAVRGALNPR